MAVVTRAEHQTSVIDSDIEWELCAQEGWVVGVSTQSL